MRKTLTHPAQQRSPVASVVALLLVTLTLTACETTGGMFGGSPGESRAERLASNGRYEDAAGIYIGLAAAASGYEKDRLTLLAVEQWLDAGDTTRARRAFDAVVRPGASDLRWLWNTNQAALLLYAGEPDAALSILEAMSLESLPGRHRLRVEALRGDAWIQKGDPARSVELMTQREIWLRDRRSIEQNRWRLWQGLVVSDPQLLRASAETALDENVKAWLELGSLAASTGQQGIGWINGAVRWRDAHGGHPAMAIIDRLQIPARMSLDYPRQIALLLPLTGRAGAAGHAIQHGFFGAYFSTAAGLDDHQTVRVYDVSNEGGASAAYTTAVADGAEFIIGPLLRSSVSELANDILVPVPVLTLNYLPDDTLAPPGLYQFALAPEDEARSAADRALADGHTRALALVPNNDWGRRVLSSFASQFEALGGTLLDHRTYTPGIQDFSNTIEDLMALSGSVRRYQRLRANIGGPLQFDPRRRQDGEFIFLAADAPAGRLLKSQLKFHYSGDLPVYSTSEINAMDGRSNADLNGIMFADTPWVIAPQHWIENLPALYQEYWPDERRLGRLHAMGYDAYQLIAALFAARTGPMQEIDGATGRLYLDYDGRVRRRLAWAQFQGGEPVALPDTDYGGGPIQDTSEDAELLLPDAADDESWYDATREL
ncbi:MAG: penicillin-binding protein activator [Gammaproteobacteria bacterium]|nr:penicillin-binding protein activator [Gammaproteobacteria bacterium]